MKKIIMLSIVLFTGVQLISAQPQFSELQDIGLYAGSSVVAAEQAYLTTADAVIAGGYANLKVSGTVFSSGSSKFNLCTAELDTIISELNDTSNVSYTMINGTQNGAVFYPGVYQSSGNVLMNQSITLVGNSSDYFQFNIDGNLDLSAGLLINAEGIDPSKVIWNINGNFYAGNYAQIFGIYITTDNLTLSGTNIGYVTLFSKKDITLDMMAFVHSPNNIDEFLNFVPPSFDSCSVDSHYVQSVTGPVCGNTTKDFNRIANWVNDSVFNLDPPLIEVGVNVHIFLDSNGQNNYSTPAEMDQLRQMFDWANGFISRDGIPTRPVRSVCGDCRTPNPNIKMVLNRIESYTIQSLHKSNRHQDFEAAMMARDPDMRHQINVYIGRGSLSTASGYANFPVHVTDGNPNNHFYSVIFGAYSPSGNGRFVAAITLAHEWGHNFRLNHTYGNGRVGSAVCDVNSGLYLDDVHGPASNQVCPHNPKDTLGRLSLWGCGGDTSQLTCTNNLMGGSWIASYLSPKQYGMMSRSLRTWDLRDKILNCPYTATPFVVDSNTVWDDNLYLFRDIVVKAGNKLTVTCRLALPEQASIIVEPNAILEVDGGLITSSCRGKYWEGIDLQGDYNQEQYPLDHPTYQGKLVLTNGAVIENARYAIQCWDPGNYLSTGGLIQAQNATIRNTRRAVSFLSYKKRNHSYFREVTFINDTNIHKVDSTIFLPLVSIWDNRGITFEACHFTDESNYNEYSTQNASGIFSIDAGYVVRGLCPNPPFNSTDPCPVPVVRGSFNNLNQGIYAITSAGSNSKIVIVDQTDFTDNSIGFRMKRMDLARFTRNNLVYGGILKQGYSLEPDFHEQYGLLSDYSDDFTIEANVFEGRANPVMDVAGVKVIEAGTDDNLVYRNEFKGNTIGQLYRGRNRNMGASFQGLQFLCNDNTLHNDHDVLVEVRPRAGIGQFFDGVRTLQGSSTFSAANIFASTNTNEGHLKNTSAQVFTYYYNTVPEEPLHYTAPKVTKLQVTTNNNTCPVKHTGMQILNKPGFPVVIDLPPTMINDYYTERATYQNLLYNYYQQLDNGNTDSLINAINLVIPTQAQQMRDNLIAQSPFVSTPALMSAANSGIMTDALLLEVCLANPEATQSEGFLDYVEYDIPNPLPATMVQLIYQSWGTETARTLLEGQLADYNATLGLMSRQILEHYVSDTLDHADSVKSILESRNSLQSQYRLVEFGIEEEDFTTSNTIMTDILNKFNLDAEQVSEHNNLQLYINFRSNLVVAGKTYMQLDEGELTTLRSIADANTGRSSALAQNILCFGYGECTEPVPPPTRLKKRPDRIYDMTPVNPDLFLDDQKITVSPNPATEEILLRIESWEAGDQVEFQLVTMQGRTVMNRRISQPSERMNIGKYKKGAYLYKVIINQKEHEFGKLLIQ